MARISSILYCSLSYTWPLAGRVYGAHATSMGGGVYTFSVAPAVLLVDVAAALSADADAASSVDAVLDTTAGAAGAATNPARAMMANISGDRLLGSADASTGAVAAAGAAAA